MRETLLWYAALGILAAVGFMVMENEGPEDALTAAASLLWGALFGVPAGLLLCWILLRDEWERHHPAPANPQEDETDAR